MTDTDPFSGSKRLTPENWLERDPTLDVFVRVVPSGIQPLTDEHLAQSFLSIELSGEVPSVTQQLFHTVQALCVYGDFFYPFFALAHEQTTRVGEAAIGEKFKVVDGPLERKRFASRLGWLRDEGYLSEIEYRWWDSVRELRNYASHLELRTLLPPGEVLSFLHTTAHAINALFDDEVRFEERWGLP